MKSVLHLTIIFLSILILSGCTKKIGSKEEFKKLPEAERKKFINESLREYGLQTTNPFDFQYIEHILFDCKYSKVIEKIESGLEYEEYLKNSIPILICTFNQNKYDKTPANIKNKVDKFLIQIPDYTYSFGESQFREFLRAAVESKFPYFIHDKSGDPTAAINNGCDKYTEDYIAGLFWESDAFFKDFLKLNISEQSSVLNQVFIIRLLRNSENFDVSDVEFADNLKKLFEKHHEEIIAKTNNMFSSDNAKFGDAVSEMSTLLIRKKYNTE